ncbi:MAG: TolC family protein [Cyanobacteria bacterium REEB67]|nr:TolC family protein [Cyanobacteria bacterium REEB67]
MAFLSFSQLAPTANAQPEVYQPSPLIYAPSTSDSTPDTRPGTSDRPNQPVDRFSLSLSEAFRTAATNNPDVLATSKIIDLAAAEANIELVENQKEFIDKLYTIAHKRVLAKKATTAEESQAKIAVDQFEVLRTSALATLRQASVKLDYLLGYKASRDLDVEDNGLFRLSSTHNELVPQPDFNVPPLSQLLTKAYEQRPDLKASVQQVMVNGRALSLAKRQVVPDVLVGSGYVFSTYNVSRRHGRIWKRQ